MSTKKSHTPEEKVVFTAGETEHDIVVSTPVETASESTPESQSPTLYPMIALREGVLFPHTESILTFARTKSVAAVEEAVRSHRQVVIVAQRKDTAADPADSDLYTVGVLASVERILKGEHEINALVSATTRVTVKVIHHSPAYFECEVDPLEDVFVDDAETAALCRVLTAQFRKAVNLGKAVEFLNFMKLMGGVSASELADQVASTLDLPSKKKQKLLEQIDVKARLRQVLATLQEEMKVLEIERSIASKTQKKFDKHARENILRERMRVIQKELGDLDEDEEGEELEQLKRTIERSAMPLDVKKKALKELKRLVSMSEMSAESGYIRSWLDAIVELPWGKYSKKSLSLPKAKEVLDAQHYGLEEVKDRILEFLAVMKLKEAQGKKDEPKKKIDIKKTKKFGDARHMPTILCFVGPPGVGKTSLGKSIAQALGREFVKISLGGIKDEAEIRGHRRTYVGAMSGRIIAGMRQAGKMNPVFMLDEIDKIGLDYRGDPSAALLEALDPEQNGAFEDHYLDVPFDLSQVMFITTANVLDTIPPALKDRLEIIRYSGYTVDEKFEIARRHLLAKQLKLNAVSEKQIKIPDDILRDIIEHYTREAGVRSLERAIGKVIRKAARLIAEGKKKIVTVDIALVEDFLGPHIFEPSLMEQHDQVGVVTGLAWTSVGGDTLSVEVALTPDRKHTSLILTGQLGKVMQESARAALTYVQSNAKTLGISDKLLKGTEIHIHVPEGAVPKDGPSAGVTMTTALISALTNTPVRRDIAMTGEVTLRGNVLEIGGLKEKVIAAHRAGIREIIAPHMNKKDWVKMPDNIKKEMKFNFVEHMRDVTAIALVQDRIRSTKVIRKPKAQAVA
ncbi:endopeptidase La [Candidatus Cerribacteria bacterium 'Amazon FNV 2010 28 9']|uniref:Lon protease n=1 Tax=Candidatus Cerribacteria bacterium 'Amazon FNV 2010 28 9' TaxID=2081795 RepID=A0A317JTZ7_9BACT|nr:MAG: endopeptidase La [Candidatus Cerribacteria bacterium 'Amazon FNV 2010 28 9']